MIATVLVTAAIAALAMLPGVLLMRGSKPQVGQWAAAATASLVATMLATALIGELSALAGLGQVPAAAMIAVALLGTAGAAWLTRGRPWHGEPLEWQGAALVAVFAGFAILSEALAVREDASGALLIHAWYNADWFKHLGHVAALADFGVPARDAFNNAEPLHYYWLSYVLPGAGAALGGDNWAALETANTIVTALFCLTLYGTIRTATSSRTASLVAGTLGLFVCAPLSFVRYFLSGGGLEALLSGPSAPKGPALLTLSQYVPQHTLTIAVFLAWLLLNLPERSGMRPVRLLALTALASAMTLSTLLGAMVLAAYGLIALWERRARAIPEVAAMAVVSGLLVLALGVIMLNHPGSAIESPLLANPPDPRPWPIREGASLIEVVGDLGPPLLVALFVLRHWRPAEARSTYVWRTAIVLMVVGVAAALVAELLTARLAIETRIRLVNLPAIAVAMIGAWAIAHWWNAGSRARLAVVATLAALVLLALPSAVIRTIWHWQIGDRYTTAVPRDDRAALAYLKRESRPTAIVWQYPEPPLLARPGGGDAWAVVLGGRTVTGSQRATDYASAVPRIVLAQRFFAGEPVAIPPAASWVYLSRALHPASYDALVARMAADPAWRRRACYADACLFERLERAAAK